jgi:hypothetical protein
MKLNVIEKVLRRSHMLLATRDRDNDVLWLSDGGVYMPMFGMAGLTMEQIRALMGITEEELDKWTLFEEDREDTGICLDDYPPEGQTEEALERSSVKIVYAGFCVEPMQTAKGLLFLDEKDLKVFDKYYKNVDLFARFGADGSVYVAVKEGMFLKGIISGVPYVVTAELGNALGYYAAGIKALLEKAEEARAE